MHARKMSAQMLGTRAGPRAWQGRGWAAGRVHLGSMGERRFDLRSYQTYFCRRITALRLTPVRGPCLNHSKKILRWPGCQVRKDPAVYGSGQSGDSRVVGSDQPATSTEQTHARDLIDQSMLLGRKPEGKLLRAFSTVCTGVYSDGVNEPSSLLSGFHRVLHQSSHREPHASPLRVCAGTYANLGRSASAPYGVDLTHAGPRLQACHGCVC